VRLQTIGRSTLPPGIGAESTRQWGARAGRAHSVGAVARHVRFEDFRYVGDRDAQRVYDQDTEDEVTGEVVARLVATNRATAFSPDTLAEARNRGYELAS
jgi:hypothetical protein